MEGYSLEGHVFKTLKAQRESACDVRCFIEHNCMSFNTGISRKDNAYICELSDSDHEMHPGALVRRDGFTYKAMEVSFIRLYNALTFFKQFTSEKYTGSFESMRGQRVLLTSKWISLKLCTMYIRYSKPALTYKRKAKLTCCSMLDKRILLLTSKIVTFKSRCYTPKVLRGPITI